MLVHFRAPRFTQVSTGFTRSVAVVLCLFCCVNVLAQNMNRDDARAFGPLDAVVTEPILETICTRLRATDDQQVIIHSIWTTYVEDVRSLGRDAVAGQNAAGQDELQKLIEEARRTRQPVDPERRAALMRDIANATIPFLNRADERLKLFIADVGTVLEEEQRDRLPEIEPLVMRLTELRMRGEGVQDRLTVRPNLHRLLERDLDGAESFYDYVIRYASPDHNVPSRDAFENELHLIIRDYERRLDPLIRPWFDDRRHERRELRIMMEWGSPEWRRQQTSLVDRRRLVMESAGRIAQLINETAGLRAQEAWTLRVDRMMMPALFEEYLPERIHAWAKLELANEPQTLQAIEDLYDRYREEQRQRITRIIREAMAASASHVQANDWRTPAMRAFVSEYKAFGDAVRDFPDRLTPHLTPAQREKVDAILLDIVRHHPRQRGPSPTAEELEILE